MKEAKDFKLPDYQPYEDETWVTLKEGNNYVVSNYGRVKHKQRRKCLVYKQYPKGNRLYGVYFFNNEGKRVSKTVGQIVANNFVDNPDGFKFIRYKDGDPHNNVASNIVWSEVRQEHNKPVILNDDGRTCTVCQEFKSWDNFCNSSKGIRGKIHTCYDCMKEYAEENHEHLRIQSQIRYYDNREEILEKAREHNTETKEERSRKAKIYREENKELIKERREKNPTKYILFKDKLTIDEDPRFNRVGELEVKCAHCREYFKPSYAHTMARVIALNNAGGTENRLYCSDECKLACPVFNTREHYRGTKTYKDRQVNPVVRDKVRERDNYECQICGATEELQVHHIIPHVVDESLDEEIDNNITLCLSCHKWIHKNIPGCRYKELSNRGSNE